MRAESAQKASNKAVTVKILKSSTTDVLFGETAKKGRIFIVLETEWENIHPKQKVEKDNIIPPETFVRFELAYETEDSPSSLYFRGYRSEATLNFHAVESPSRRGEIE